MRTHKKENNVLNPSKESKGLFDTGMCHRLNRYQSPVRNAMSYMREDGMGWAGLRMGDSGKSEQRYILRSDLKNSDSFSLCIQQTPITGC